MRKAILIASSIALLFILGFSYLLLAPGSSKNSAVGSGGKIVFGVAPKSGVDKIAYDLAAENLIRSRMVFKIWSFLTGRASGLKPGLYSINPGQSVPQMVFMLWQGPKDIQVTIPPGATMAEIDDKLAGLGIIKQGSILNISSGDLENANSWLLSLANQGVSEAGLKPLTNTEDGSTIYSKRGNSLEGFLLPDTYFITPSADPEAVLQKILDNFQTKALPLFPQGSDIFRALTIASILEKEAPDYRDRQIIAGILDKRLAAGMPLQVDATIVYAKCEGRFIGCQLPKAADYGVDSPYNTYAHTGLPPGPIGNPGLDAIRAALNPLRSGYWYYLSDPKTQQTIFSRTLDEHNQNRVKYLLAR